MLSRWVCIPLPDPPQVLYFFSPHPLPHLPCRLSQVLLYLSLIFSFEKVCSGLRAYLGHCIPSRGSLLYSRFGSFQLSVYPLSVDAQASHVLADLSKYITLECLGVLHLSFLRYNPLLLHQITSAPLSQPNVFVAFLNHVSPSPLRSSLSPSYSLTWYAVVSWRSCTVFRNFPSRPCLWNIRHRAGLLTLRYDFWMSRKVLQSPFSYLLGLSITMLLLSFFYYPPYPHHYLCCISCWSFLSDILLAAIQ